MVLMVYVGRVTKMSWCSVEVVCFAKEVLNYFLLLNLMCGVCNSL